MSIPIKAIQEYREIYRRQYGSVIPIEQARQEGEKFLRFFRIVYRPISDQIEMKEYETHKA